MCFRGGRVRADEDGGLLSTDHLQWFVTLSNELSNRVEFRTSDGFSSKNLRGIVKCDFSHCPAKGCIDFEIIVDSDRCAIVR
jgi:hypothetical protein